MGHEFGTDPRFPVDLIAPGRQALARKGIEVQCAMDRKRAESRARAAAAAVDDARKHLRDKVGARALAELDAALSASRRTMAAALEPPQGIDADRAKLVQAHRRRLAQAATRLGVDPAVMRDLATAYRKSVEATLAPDMREAVPGGNVALDLARWKSLSPLHGRAIDIEPPPRRW